MERGGGAAAVPFEDPLWNFKRGGRAPPAAPPPESASVHALYSHAEADPGGGQGVRSNPHHPPFQSPGSASDMYT